MVFHGMEIHVFHFCPEAVLVSHGLGLENSVRCRKAVLFALQLTKGSWNSSVLETPEILGNLG